MPWDKSAHIFLKTILSTLLTRTEKALKPQDISKFILTGSIDTNIFLPFVV